MHLQTIYFGRTAVHNDSGHEYVLDSLPRESGGNQGSTPQVAFCDKSDILFAQYWYARQKIVRRRPLEETNAERP